MEKPQDNAKNIENMIYETFDEEWKSSLCLELLNKLGKGKIDEAKEIADKAYRENMQNERLDKANP